VSAPPEAFGAILKTVVTNFSLFFFILRFSDGFTSNLINPFFPIYLDFNISGIFSSVIKLACKLELSFTKFFSKK